VAPGSTPDTTLVALAARGDERAFEHLFQRHRTDVLAYASRRLRDHGRAEDVVQDVFVSAMRAIVGAAPEDQPVHVRAWLREIARRACIDQWRGTTRRGEISLDAPGGLRTADADRLTDEDSLDRATDDREAVATLRLAFDDLPELQHRILVQRELEGRSVAEIAARLELSTTVVEGQLARGRRTLGRSYRELESGERCVAVRALCDRAAAGPLGVRDRHRIGRHVRGCDGCRRHAHERGVDPRIISGALATRAAAFLPLPLLRRLPLDHPIAGDAAGGLLGAKVLVGAVVLAAGSGGVYAARDARPVPPAASDDASAGAGSSALGLRLRPDGSAVLRVPGDTGLAATAVLPVRAGGADRPARPYLPPWLGDPSGVAVAPGVEVPAAPGVGVAGAPAPGSAPAGTAPSYPPPTGVAPVASSASPSHEAAPSAAAGGTAAGSGTAAADGSPSPTGASSPDAPAEQSSGAGGLVQGLVGTPSAPPEASPPAPQEAGQAEPPAPVASLSDAPGPQAPPASADSPAPEPAAEPSAAVESLLAPLTLLSDGGPDGGA
jgi:RNA polymerase sigma factor (sigma-70 family)